MNTQNKASWEDIARQFHDIYEKNAYLFGYITRLETREFDPKSANGKLMILTVREVLKNFVHKDEVREMLEDFVETLKFDCEHNFHGETVVFGDSITLELMKYLKLKSLE